MTTRANIYYPSTTDQDGAWGTDIRKLLETTSTATSTTICTHPNAAGTTQITLDPYTNSSTASDIRDALGWAIDAGNGADGMGATTTYQRRIQAGSWAFSFPASVPVGGTATGSLTVSFSARVYRVGASPGFARTALFTTALSTTVASTGLAVGTGTCTVTQSSVPEIVIEAGETIHVGFISNLVQVAGLVGATVSGVATWTTGTAFVNPPQLDTITQLTGSAAGSGTATALAARVMPTVASAAGLGVAPGVLGAIKGTVASAAGIGLAAGTLAAVKGLSGAASGTGTATGKIAKVAGFVGTVSPSGGGGGTTIIKRSTFVFDD